MRAATRRSFVTALALTLTLAAPRLRADVPAAASPRDPAPDDPVLDSLVTEALARNPDLRAAQERVEAARVRPAQARSLPDPMLSMTYTNDGWAPTLGEMPMTTLAFMGSQDLPYPGKRGLRGDLTSLEADQVAQQLERARLSVTASVKRAYYGLLQARALLEIVREQADLWRQIEGLARSRYAVGQGAQQDVLRVQIEVTRIGQLEAEQLAEAQVRLAEINRLLDREPGAPIETNERLHLAPAGGPLPEVLESLRGLSPELKDARLAVERGRVAVALARKDFKPDFNVQAAYMNRGGLDPMWLAGVGVKLPVYRKRIEGAVAEAEARLRESERRVEAVELQLRFRTQERLAQLEAAAVIARLFDGGVIPQGRMSVEAAIASYESGKVPFVSVLEALYALYNDRSAYVRVLAGHASTRASLEEASLDPGAGLPPLGGAPAMATNVPGGAGSGMSGGMGNR
jgi:outer membrane protein, heavy metal efflux system